jgi:hypothetical protein
LVFGKFPPGQRVESAQVKALLKEVPDGMFGRKMRACSVWQSPFTGAVVSNRPNEEVEVKI